MEFFIPSDLLFIQADKGNVIKVKFTRALPSKKTEVPLENYSNHSVDFTPVMPSLAYRTFLLVSNDIFFA